MAVQAAGRSLLLVLHTIISSVLVDNAGGWAMGCGGLCVGGIADAAACTPPSKSNTLSCPCQSSSRCCFCSFWGLDDPWLTDQGAVYRWMRGDDLTPPVLFLARHGSTATAAVEEVDGTRNRVRWSFY